jgi:NTP pyrophosphatase (non-canonical NTP hydrolase)
MTFDEYDKAAGSTAIYPRFEFALHGVVYCTLGLNGEAGELAEKLKKTIRDNNGVIADRFEFAKELGDCLWYISRLAAELGLTMEQVAIMNVEKLASRKDRGQLQGSGDNR